MYGERIESVHLHAASLRLERRRLAGKRRKEKERREERKFYLRGLHATTKTTTPP